MSSGRPAFVLSIVPLLVGITLPTYAATSLAEIRATFERANVQYRAQHYDSAAVAYVEASEMAREAPADSVWQIMRDAPYNAACCHALLGNATAAFQYLDSAAANAFWDEAFLSNDRDLKSLRTKPEFKAMKLRLRHLKDSLSAKLRDTSPLVILPSDTSTFSTLPIVILLHAENSLPQAALDAWRDGANAARVILLAPFGFRCRSPRELSWGMNADSADRTVLSALNRMNKFMHGRHGKVIIAGVGQGAQMAYQLGMKHAELFQGVVAANGYYNAQYCNKFVVDARRYGSCLYGIYDASGSLITASTLRAEEFLRNSGINIVVRPLSGAKAGVDHDRDELVRAFHWMIDE